MSIVVSQMTQECVPSVSFVVFNPKFDGRALISFEASAG